ncbi:MAG: hypothetical protein DRN95_08910, partial [Candidatus Hydrothermarchaeota archaeon]
MRARTRSSRLCHQSHRQQKGGEDAEQLGTTRVCGIQCESPRATLAAVNVDGSIPVVVSGGVKELTVIRSNSDSPATHDRQFVRHAAEVSSGRTDSRPVRVEVTENGHGFSITHVAAGRVEIEVTSNGNALGHFPLDTQSTAVERILELELARSGCLDDAGQRRNQAVARVLAAARGVALEAHTGPSEESGEALARKFMRSLDPIPRLLEDMKEVGFRADPKVGIVLYLCKISALLKEPVYVYLLGPASSLKTSYADLVATLTPPEMLKHLTDLTPKALYYGTSDLKNFVIVLDEMDLRSRGTAKDRKILRELFSKGWCKAESTEGRRSRERRVDGPVMVIQTTVATQFDEQDSSRHLLIELPDCPERTRAVLDMMGAKYAGLDNGAERGRIVETHRSIHRMLPRNADVCVPFAQALDRLLPPDRIKILRTFRIIVDLIKASALLHMHHREQDGEGRILATLDDYRIVYEHAGEFIAQSISEASKSAPAAIWVETLIQKRAERMLARAKAGEHEQLKELKRQGETEFLRDNRRWHRWMSLATLMDLTECPRTTVQRHLTVCARSSALVQVGVSARAGRCWLLSEGGLVELLGLPGCGQEA